MKNRDRQTKKLLISKETVRNLASGHAKIQVPTVAFTWSCDCTAAIPGEPRA